MCKIIFPVEWKRQSLILLSKDGKPPGESPSYKPITFQNTKGKMLERIIYNILLPVVESREGVSYRQYVFLNVRSTINDIKLVTGLARNAVPGRDCSNSCVVVTLEERNAFNSANWNLIKSLWRGFVIPSI